MKKDLHEKNHFFPFSANKFNNAKNKSEENNGEEINKVFAVYYSPRNRFIMGGNTQVTENRTDYSCKTTRKHIENGFQLGVWVSNQRTRNELLAAERRQRLVELGVVWDVLEEAWEEGFNCLLCYKAREGHCIVPQRFIENGFRLGQWVSVQRQNKKLMFIERRERLVRLGFVWDPHENAWEEGFRYLNAYKQREGHCRVPHRYVENGYRLGGWVDNQRTTQAQLSPERRQRLNHIGFLWRGDRLR